MTHHEHPVTSEAPEWPPKPPDVRDLGAITLSLASSRGAGSAGFQAEISSLVADMDARRKAPVKPKRRFRRSR